jgi:hypothetical protein
MLRVECVDAAGKDDDREEGEEQPAAAAAVKAGLQGDQKEGKDGGSRQAHSYHHVRVEEVREEDTWRWRRIRRGRRRRK